MEVGYKLLWEGEKTLTNPLNSDINSIITQWENYHTAYAMYYMQLKMAAFNNPSLYTQYEKLQNYHRAMADQYKAMLAHTAFEPSNQNQNQNSLLKLISSGGYILYARHAQASVGEDQVNLNFLDCNTQRNLSDEGKRQAIAYGNALRSLRIPIQFPVHTSPFCRTRQTAEFAFGKENVAVNPLLIATYELSNKLTVQDQQKLLNNLQSILEIQPPAGNNQVIIAHSFPNGVGLGEIPYMGTVIVKPLGQGKGYEIVGRLSLEDLIQEQGS